MELSELFKGSPTSIAAKSLGIIVLSTAALKSCSTVDTGEAGVVTTFGKVERVVDSGLAFHWPWQGVSRMDLKSHTVDIPLEVYSKDSQLAPTNVLSVTFSLPRDKVEEVFTKYGPEYFQAVLKNPVENIFREAFGTKTADEIISDRVVINNDVSTRLKTEFETRGVLFERISISIKFNEAFNTSAEKSAIARTEVNTATQNLERTKKDAESAEAKAKGEANADFAKKQKEAEGILALGKAQAEVLELKAKVAAANPSLVNLLTADKWDGKLPTTMIPGQGTPLIQLDLKDSKATSN